MPTQMITYQFRIKDNSSHKVLERMASAVNYVWNYANEISMFALRRDHKWLSGFDLNYLTKGVSKELGIAADTVQMTCQEYTSRRKAAKKPRLHWRSKKRSLGWIPFNARGTRSNIKLNGETVAYCGHTFRLWLHREIVGTPKTGSFTQDPRKRWYFNLTCEIEAEPQTSLGLDAVGIDLGLKDTITCSDGSKYSRDNITRQYADDLAKAQRARKKKRVKAIYAKVANKRKDFAHKATTDIANRFDFIAVGNVSSAKLAKTRMAKSVYDAGWSQVRTLLKYKAQKLGGRYVDVNESFSSVTCSACFSRSGPSGLGALGVREWVCIDCGCIHDRDINAAQNILRAGRCTPIKGIRLF
jgi:IS605 OrfB family transposase